MLKIVNSKLTTGLKIGFWAFLAYSVREERQLKIREF